jgi:hypothetical protein
MAPNSAGAERLFPLLKILLGSNLNTALSDYTRGQTKMAENFRKKSVEMAG